ncbi:hypothetical protein HMPREF3036_00403 [Sutterella sp. KLE1602]|nr:hypothetical protein HMPREF3036_00403 [Sutterella sp. KLE1602]
MKKKRRKECQRPSIRKSDGRNNDSRFSTAVKRLPYFAWETHSRATE